MQVKPVGLPADRVRYAQVADLQKKYGLNRLTPPKETSEIIKFLLQVCMPCIAWPTAIAVLQHLRGTSLFGRA